MTVGENIRRYRKAKGLTQKALGQIVGVAPNTVTQWENGTNAPKMPQLKKLAGALDVEVINFLPNSWDYLSKNTLDNKQALEEAFRYTDDAVTRRVLTELDQKLEHIGFFIDVDAELGLCLTYPDGTLQIEESELQNLNETLNSFARFTLSELKRKQSAQFRSVES
jgi:Predicted transcriptional regulators